MYEYVRTYQLGTEAYVLQIYVEKTQTCTFFSVAILTQVRKVFLETRPA